MNNILRPAIVLLLITFISAGLLGFANAITLGPIEEQRLLAEATAMKNVLPAADSFPESAVLTEDPSFDGYNITKVAEGLNGFELEGYVITTVPKGFGGKMTVMVGISKDGLIRGIDILEHEETPGLGANADTDDFKAQFVDMNGPISVSKTAPAGDAQIVAITGATITSNAVSNAVNEALDWVLSYRGGGN